MKITERIDRITLIPPEYRHEVLPAPRSVKIELTGRCNFQCSFCAQSHGLRKKGDMRQSFFSRILPEMRGAGVEEIGLFYLGESFLLSWLAEAIEYAKTVAGFPYVFLTTNGSLANRMRVEACMAAGLDSLKFSLNYADVEQFKEIAQVKPSLFERMIENIKTAYEVRETGGYKTGLYASYIRYDGEQGERMAGMIEELAPYLDEIYALPLYNQASLVEGRGALKDMTPGNRGRADALRDPLPCWAVATEGHITFDGKLSACCFDHNDRFTMADLTKTTFMDGWNSVKFQELRRKHLVLDVSGTPCEDCLNVLK